MTGYGHRLDSGWETLMEGDALECVETADALEVEHIEHRLRDFSGQSWSRALLLVRGVDLDRARFLIECQRDAEKGRIKEHLSSAWSGRWELLVVLLILGAVTTVILLVVDNAVALILVGVALFVLVYLHAMKRGAGFGAGDD